MPERGSSARASELRRLLIDARAAKGLKQNELAKRLGRPQSFISNYETGQRRLGVIEFIDIAHALGLDPGATVAELAAKP
jgi:transcriptional regulator with XRE-family HTH domain